MTSYIPSLTLPAAVFAHPAVSVLFPVACGTAVGFATRPTATQKTYLALKQPPFRPPPQVFGPAWTVLYGLMGFAAWRACKTGLSPLASPATVELTKHGATLYSMQLALNLAWMPLFFVAKRPIEATVDIVALTGIVGYMTYVWGQVDRVAAYALVPYVAWLGFATYLSAGAGYLNDWSIADKEVPSESKSTKFVDEKPE